MHTTVSINDTKLRTVFAYKYDANAALGCVYKLGQFSLFALNYVCLSQLCLPSTNLSVVELDGQPRIKLSEQPVKMTIPCKKSVYRLLDAGGMPLADVLGRKRDGQGDEEGAAAAAAVPLPGVPFACMHLHDFDDCVQLTPAAVVDLQPLMWDGPSGKGLVAGKLPTIEENREYIREQIAAFNPAVLRAVDASPEAYRVSTTEELRAYTLELLNKEKIL